MSFQAALSGPARRLYEVGEKMREELLHGDVLPPMKQPTVAELQAELAEARELQKATLVQLMSAKGMICNQLESLRSKDQKVKLDWFDWFRRNGDKVRRIMTLHINVLHAENDSIDRFMKQYPGDK